MNLKWKEIQGGKFYSGRLGALLWTKHYSKYKDSILFPGVQQQSY